MEQTQTMKDRLLDQSNKSDIPTITYVTPKAIIFYTAAILAILGMFGNWFAIDLDLGYLQLNDVLGTVNPFTMGGALSELEDSLGMLSLFMPSDFMDGLGMLRFFSYVLMILAIVSIALYVYAALLRLKENDRCARIGKLAAGCALLTVVGFVGMAVVLLSAMEVSSVLGSALGIILISPCAITLASACITIYCAPMDMGFKEDVVIYYDGTIKIDKGPKWTCNACHRRNLSRLEKCYYCGMEKQ